MTHLIADCVIIEQLQFEKGSGIGKKNSRLDC